MSIPVAPRPFADEAMRSWIGRVAARYDLEPEQLVWCLRGARAEGAHYSEFHEIHWRPDAELEYLLAQATRLDVTRIAELRIPIQGLPDPSGWHRQSRAWCPLCVNEDVRRYGETYERAVWQLGFCAVCSARRQTLRTP